MAGVQEGGGASGRHDKDEPVKKKPSCRKYGTLNGPRSQHL